jgi:hypothetical protein
MINTRRRWSLPVILGSAVLLLAGTGLFLIVRAGYSIAPESVQRAVSDSLSSGV